MQESPVRYIAARRYVKSLIAKYMPLPVLNTWLNRVHASYDVRHVHVGAKEPSRMVFISIFPSCSKTNWNGKFWDGKRKYTS